MEVNSHRFYDLATLIEEMHSLFDRWMEVAEQTGSKPDPDTLLYLRVAVHEWMANLVQHAAFQQTPPEVELMVKQNGRGTICVIEDNSEGFDLKARLEERHRQTEPFPQRGMGLLWLEACADKLSYDRVGDRHRLSFVILPDQNACVNLPF